MPRNIPLGAGHQETKDAMNAHSNTVNSPETRARTSARLQQHREAAGLAAMRSEMHQGVAVHRMGTGPALVLLHGGRGSWCHWIHNIGPLSRHFSLHVLDLPGFGASAPVPREWPYADYLSLLSKALVEITDGRPFLLAGFSFGAQTAAMLTAHHLGEQVRRLSLLAPAGWGNDGDIGRESRKSLRDVTTVEGRREVFRHNLGTNQIADPVRITEHTVDLLEYNIAHSVFHSPQAGSLPVLLDALPKIHCPLQVMAGERDILQKPSLEWRMARIREAAPQVIVEPLAGAGHWAQYEVPEAYNQRLITFMQSQSAGRQ